MPLYREAGLPPLIPNDRSEHQMQSGSKGVVRAVYPEENRVDIETEDGSLLSHCIVCGPYFPEIHVDSDRPSHAAYLWLRGMAEAICWPWTFRRLLHAKDPVPEADGDEAPERRYYHTHHSIVRLGEITVRLTRDDRYVIETEKGDYIQIDTKAREICAHAPSVFVGTEKDTRGEYQRDEYWKFIIPHTYVGTDTDDRLQLDVEDGQQHQAQLVIPRFFLGKTGLVDQDGLSYIADQVLHLVSTGQIKLTAPEVVIDPVSILLGSNGATEQAVLGNLFLTLFNTHTHGGVQNGVAHTAIPDVLMTTTELSDCVKIAKTGS